MTIGRGSQTLLDGFSLNLHSGEKIAICGPSGIGKSTILDTLGGGGGLQRLSIARALTANPKVLLADEPTSRLDPITQKDTLDLIAKISHTESIAVVLVTHSLEIAQKWADNVIDLTN
ncbi:MAG: ATP-binding cassette domain-containing protein [Gammaproteobacteria bacterium]|nr:ATP-binding cassette domain-containing protein [Gammaproteobacteria bacterium]